MLQAEAERIECEPTCEPDDPIDDHAPHVECESCDEPTERWHECVDCGAVVCPCCAFARASDDYSCEACSGAIDDDRCPICGEHVTLTGETTDGRLIGSCGDAFTREQWEACPECGESDERCECDPALGGAS